MSLRSFLPAYMKQAGIVGSLLLASAGLGQAQGLAGPTAVLHSPYYHAYQPKAVPGAPARIGVVPARLQHPAAKRIFSKTRAQALLDSISRFLGRQPGLTAVALPAEIKPQHLPDVYFGTTDQELPGTLPGYVQNLKCPNPGQSCVQLAGWNGQGSTRQALLALMAAQKLDYLLLPIVREANIYFSQKMTSVGPISGGSASATSYYLDQGSQHVEHLSRLNDLNGTAGLLVLTGALIDAKGNLVLIGAETLKSLGVGFQPVRLSATEPFMALPADYEVLLRPLLRDDLSPPRPAWQEAATQLSQRLTGRLPYREDSPYLMFSPPQPGR
ncbi:hypothetical protein GCM10023185_41080 [Hymenobacter saemangeumensis]|uniref:Uncharacterized protein n=1 Tax=Hymenobacter saemangeumensis TaxID=1084522 RepID=A0ABP8IR83_9BACT